MKVQVNECFSKSHNDLFKDGNFSSTKTNNIINNSFIAVLKNQMGTIFAKLSLFNVGTG